ncbi:hypothetical protein J1614_009734 [Plenodomus biglobosus]|nr:hypothetical protein J1614_009734 [Plenodomus biglobosus]
MRVVDQGFQGWRLACDILNILDILENSSSPPEARVTGNVPFAHACHMSWLAVVCSPGLLAAALNLAQCTLPLYSFLSHTHCCRFAPAEAVTLNTIQLCPMTAAD